MDHAAVRENQENCKKDSISFIETPNTLYQTETKSHFDDKKKSGAFVKTDNLKDKFSKNNIPEDPHVSRQNVM